MPELPEVELVVRYLRPLLVGRTIRRVLTTQPSYFFLSPPGRLRAKLRNDRIDDLSRRGKYLILALSSGRHLLLHLGMTGQLIVEGAKSPRLALRASAAHGPVSIKRSASREPPALATDRHTHLSIEFADVGPTLHFRDTRKFGKVRLLEIGESDPRLSKLGADALGLTATVLFRASRRRKLRIKSLLLDQTVTAGIGNIYADESLFAARIHPERRASSLSVVECKTLANVVRRLLRLAIRAGGSSIDDYVHPDGSDGAFQRQFRVYGREGAPCRECGTPIERRVLGQRSAHFCPRCQK